MRNRLLDVGDVDVDVDSVSDDHDAISVSMWGIDGPYHHWLPTAGWIIAWCAWDWLSHQSACRYLLRALALLGLCGNSIEDVAISALQTVGRHVCG